VFQEDFSHDFEESSSGHPQVTRKRDHHEQDGKKSNGGVPSQERQRRKSYSRALAEGNKGNVPNNKPSTKNGTSTPTSNQGGGGGDSTPKSASKQQQKNDIIINYFKNRERGQSTGTQEVVPGFVH
jgi:hypothetical protein